MIFFLALLFIIGYAVIALEHPIRIDKSATALILGGLCWIILSINGSKIEWEHSLALHIEEIATIVFFLLAAMTIVEVLEAYGGFSPLTKLLEGLKVKPLLFAIGILTFFLSALLDNLATTLVILAIVRIRVPEGEYRNLFAGIVVIAANAGGAFSPIGDITTTMLWISGKISFPLVIWHLFLPSLVSFLIPLIWIQFSIPKGKTFHTEKSEASGVPHIPVLILGMAVLLSVPIMKTGLGLPPFLTLLTGLGLIWFVTEIFSRKGDRFADASLKLPSALRKIDLSSILFFIGILLAVGALEEAHLLRDLSTFLLGLIGNQNIIAVMLGLLSSVFDNVPLVAGAIKMFPQIPSDAIFWHWLAFTAGTGGSILVIGSAAGITAMGAAGLKFGWYLRKMTIPALLGYLGGLMMLFIQGVLFP